MKFTLEQIFEYCKGYKDLCEIFLGLETDPITKEKLKSILYNGSYLDYNVSSNLANRDNPIIEAQRRLSLAYLLVKNPQTFDTFVKKNINIFHGTNANALPSILKYGLNSHQASEDMGIDVQTGEKSTRTNKKRSFISLTDVLDVALSYSTIKPNSDNESLSFEVIFGVSADDVLENGLYRVSSDIPEIGVKSNLPRENIRVICVPSDKVDFVKKLVKNSDIEVHAVDDIDRKFYSIDEAGFIYINEELLDKFKHGLHEAKTEFSIDEIKEFAFKRSLSKIKEQLEKLKMAKGLENDGKQLQ